MVILIKYKKTLIKILILLTFIIFITFKYDKINSVSDISKINKIQIYDKDESLIYECSNLHEGSYVSIDNINNFFKKAVISIEDKNFYSHSGFDLLRIAKLSILNLLNLSESGGSTITQQYIKNLYFNNERSYTRKVNELLYSYRLEKLYTKDEILEGYLNTIYFGDNIYGINDACKYYFDKTPLTINEEESAILIALIKKPSLDNLDLLNRKDEILKILLNKKVIDSSTYNKYYKNITVLKYKNIGLYENSILYFKDIVLKEYMSLDIENDFNEVIKIYTNYDKDINNKINDFIKNNSITSSLSCVVVDELGYYVANVGDIDYYKSSYNVAMKGNRDIGSTIKPLLYYEALNNGMKSTSTFTSNDKDIYYKNTKYSFSNYKDRYTYKDITMGYALATSDNIYAVKTHLSIGMDKLVNFLDKFNIKATANPSLALGSVSMSLDKLVNIYTTFLSLGYNTKNKAIKSIYCNNKLISNKVVNKTKKLSPEICYIINDLMTYMFDPMLNNKNTITGNSIYNKLNKKISAKTGLTDYDSYIVGFNPSYTIGIWTGHKDNSLLTKIEEMSLPKKLFVDVCNELENDEWFIKPENINSYIGNVTTLSDYKRTIYELK